MDRSRDCTDHLLPEHSALQHERAPRPLPLFLELVRRVAEQDPGTARAALNGLNAYERAPRPAAAAPRPETGRVGPAVLRDYGGAGPPAIIIPSLINPPSVLDLDPEVSFAAAVGGMGRRALLLDWGDARERSGLSVGGHVEQLLLPLLAELAEPAALIGYCLGGTMAIAAANLSLCERVVTLAAPWHFAGYGDEARSSLEQLWRRARGSAVALGVLPMEVLQAAFWSLDPQRTVRKYARFGELPEESPEARRFVALEDWANDGEPVPYPAARELLEDFFSADLPGRGEWRVGGAAISDSLAVPATHFAASRDRITPSTAAPSGDVVPIDAGHVGMVVGGARELLHAELASFLDPACR